MSHGGNVSMLMWKLYNNSPAANTLCPNEEEEEDMLIRGTAYHTVQGLIVLYKQ